MAVDARLNTQLPHHPKTRKLLRRLGPAGPWSFVCLIAWTAANRPSGSLDKMDEEDVELAADWDGEPGALVDALTTVGFLDPTENGYQLHDWEDHQPWLAGQERRSEAARKAALARHRGKAQDRADPCDTHADSCGSNAGRSNSHADRTNPLCPVSESDSDSEPNSSPGESEPHRRELYSPSRAREGRAEDSAPPLIALPLNDGSSYPVTEDQWHEWAGLYPAVDVMAELRKMKGWLDSNPDRKKTKKGIRRFITNWLSRAQDRGGSPNLGRGSQPRGMDAVTAMAERLEGSDE